MIGKNNGISQSEGAKVAIIGADGYLGSRLLGVARQVAPDAVGTTRRRQTDGCFLDLAAPDFTPLNLAETGHTHAIIAVARSNIMFCETYTRTAEIINVTGTLKLLKYLGDQGVLSIFLSSDRVFDTAGDGPFVETDEPNATSVYGRQKIAVERAMLDASAPSLIVRLSKVYGIEKGDRTFCDDMALRLLSGRMVDPPFDQVFNPTVVEDVIEGLFALVGAGIKGVVHLCAEPAVGRRELGLKLARRLEADPALVPEPLEPTVATPMKADLFRSITGLAPLAPLEGIARVAENYCNGI